MRQTILVLALVSTLTSCSNDKEMLQKEIEQRFNQQKGTFAVAFKNLKTGEMLLINEHEVFHAASTMKTPVMIEVYNQASQGKFSLTDSLILKNEFKSIVDGSLFSLTIEDDSERELYNYLGEKRTIAQLMYDMIIVSSNLATNLIIEKVDAEDVTETMRQLGAKETKVLRGVEDTKAFEKGLSNETSAFDLMLMFEKMAKGELVNKKSSDEMIEILLDQKFNEIIPAKLPPDVKVAHKTGSITGVRHDGGIIMLPDGRKYVLILLSKGLEDSESGIQAMAEVSKLLYDHVVQGV